MRESELANLMVQMGLDRGLTIEQVAGELSTLGMPAFVDAGAFRSHVLQAAETQLRSQVEAQINRLRQQAGLASPVSVNTPAGAFGEMIPPANVQPVVQHPVASVVDPTSPAAPVPPAQPVAPTPPAPVVERAGVEPPSDDLDAVVASLGGDERPVRETEFDIPADATVVWTNFDNNRGRSGS